MQLTELTNPWLLLLQSPQELLIKLGCHGHQLLIRLDGRDWQSQAEGQEASEVPLQNGYFGVKAVHISLQILSKWR